MARKRMIDPSIWDDEGFAGLSLVGRLLYIGMFSQADDYGKGRANTLFLKSKVFPYDDMRVAEVDKALSEIGHKTSVQFYQVNGQSYYKFKNWNNWQKVDRPTDSIIPEPFDEDSTNARRGFDEDSTRVRRPIRKEYNITPQHPMDAVPPMGETRSQKAHFIKPTLEEVRGYCEERGNKVDPQRFIDHYEANGWKIGGRSPMKDWRAAVRTWEKNGIDRGRTGGKPKQSFSQREYGEDELNGFFANEE